VPAQNKWQIPNLYYTNLRQSAPFIRADLREPLEPGSSAQGWQSLFAAETGGLLQTGNSVASAEQTSAALNLHKLSSISHFQGRYYTKEDITFTTKEAASFIASGAPSSSSWSEESLSRSSTSSSEAESPLWLSSASPSRS
jgi:hypothetical protein